MIKLHKKLTVGELKKLLNDFNDTDEVMLHSVVMKEEKYQFEDCGSHVMVDVPAEGNGVSHRGPDTLWSEGQCWIYSQGII